MFQSQRMIFLKENFLFQPRFFFSFFFIHFFSLIGKQGDSETQANKQLKVEDIVSDMLVVKKTPVIQFSRTIQSPFRELPNTHHLYFPVELSEPFSTPFGDPESWLIERSIRRKDSEARRLREKQVKAAAEEALPTRNTSTTSLEDSLKIMLDHIHVFFILFILFTK